LGEPARLAGAAEQQHAPGHEERPGMLIT
jgi:hypothetical protein